jgi:hypothetical protein
MFLLYGDEAAGETPSQITPEAGEQWAKFHEFAERSGKLVSWHALMPTEAAVTVRPDASGNLVETDGPFAETKEQLGGVYILECTDLFEAMSFANSVPCAAHGSIEVRQVLDD